MDNIFHNVNSLPQTKRNFHGKCEDGLHSLVLPGQTFQARKGHLTSRNSNKLHYVRVPYVRRKSHSDNIVPRTASFWNRCPLGYFPQHYNLNLSKSRVNPYLSCLSSKSSLHTSSFSIHISRLIITLAVNFYLYLLSTLLLKEISYKKEVS